MKLMQWSISVLAVVCLQFSVVAWAKNNDHSGGHGGGSRGNGSGHGHSSQVSSHSYAQSEQKIREQKREHSQQNMSEVMPQGLQTKDQSGDAFPNGWQKKQLPKGLQKRIKAGKALPPGWQKKLIKGQLLPDALYQQSTPVVQTDPIALDSDVKNGIVTVKLGDKLVRMLGATREILSIIE